MIYGLAHDRHIKEVRDLDASNHHILITMIACLAEIYKDRAFRPFFADTTEEETSRNIEDFIDLTEEEIEKWLIQEVEDEKFITEIIAKKRQYDAELQTSGFNDQEKAEYILAHYIELASLLGLYYPCDSRSMNKLLVGFENITHSELKDIQQRMLRNQSIITLIQMLVIGFKDGQVLKHDHGTVIKQGRRRYYYRGESAYYPKSIASIYRSSNEEEKIIRLISRMRILEFTKLLNKFDVVKNWTYGDVIYDALAQHYGIATDLLDITNDLKTALFFACCKYDDKTKVWAPLSKEDIDNADSRQHVFKAGGDSRFGIIMRADSEYFDTLLQGTEILPIGYQPFMRCSNQHGFVMKMKDADDNLKKNSNFKKYRIRLTPEFCKKVFEMKQGGRNIYPTDGLSDFGEEIKYISETQNIFSKTTLHAACEIEGIKCTNSIYQKLQRNGISIGKGGSQVYDDNKIKRINAKWSNVDWEALYGFSIQITPVFTKNGGK